MNDKHLREQLTNALILRQAHQTYDQAVKDFPPAHFNSRPPNTGYSFWQLLEHIRITQWDILDYIENPAYQYRKFPDDYWPDADSSGSILAWQRTVDETRADTARLVDIINDPARDLMAQIPHGQPGHTILREILIIASHNAYHIGELGILRGTLGLW